MKLKSQKARYWHWANLDMGQHHSLRVRISFFHLLCFPWCQLYFKDLSLRPSDGFQWVIGPYAPPSQHPRKELSHPFLLDLLWSCDQDTVAEGNELC